MHVVFLLFVLLAIVRLPDPSIGRSVRMPDLSNPIEYLTAEQLRYPEWALVEGDVVALEPRIMLFPDNLYHLPTPWAVVTLRVARAWSPPDFTDTTVTFLAHNCYYVDGQGQLKASRWSEGAGFIYPEDHLLIHLRPLPEPSPPPAYQYTIPDELRGYRFAGRFWLLEPSSKDSTTPALFAVTERFPTEWAPELLEKIRTAPSHTLLHGEDIREKVEVPVSLDSLRRHVGQLLGKQDDQDRGPW